MKNKKLFAILTLVCFMFTLMPVAAFAAAPAVGVMVEGELDQSVTVTEGDTVALTVADPKAGEAPYLFAIVKDGALYATTAGAYEFEKEGTYTVYAVSAAEATFADDATMTKAAKWTLIQEKDSFVDDVLTVKVKADKSVAYAIELDGVLVSPAVDAEDEVIEGEYNMTIAANGGWAENDEVVATLTKGGEAVKGAELTFSTAGYVDLAFEEGKTTSRGGEVEFEVSSDRTGEYKVIVKYGTKAKATLNVTVQAEAVANVAAVNVPKAPVDADQNVDAADIEFKFTDASGNAYEPATDSDDVITDSNVKISVADKPADSNVEADEYDLVKDADDKAGVYTLVGPVFDAEGEYTFKVTLKNGKSATATVKALEQGDIVGIKYDVMNTPVTVAYDAATQVNAVLAYDANGVTSLVDDATFSATGKAIKSFDASSAYLVTKDDADLIGTEITVMAKSGDFVATTTLTVVDKAATINYGEMNAEVGINNVFVGSIVDGEGKGSGVGAYSPAVDVIVLDKPADAIAVADADFDDKGRVEMSFLASEVGEYKVQTVVTYTVGEGAEAVTYYVTSIDTVTVGKGEGTFKDIVVMSIGANKIVVNSEVKAIDAAPIVENNRTFVPFRALAEAFGAEVAFDEATQAVTATLGDVTVVMTIGSAEYTVNGEVKTADVAPFINGSRTMVPVRFVAEAFGINVTPVYGDNGATVDVLFAK